MTSTIRVPNYVLPIVILILLTFVGAQAETITLRDGSKITGTITKQSEMTLEVKTPYGLLTIDKSNVLSIDYGGAIQQQQQQQQTIQQDNSAAAQLEYSRGRSDGRQKGYSDGYEKGAKEQKDARTSGAWLGFLTEVLLTTLILLLASGSAY